ncbi:MAG: DsrE family protein [Gammaproteobacteria bacterium]|nr:MAG: DsrE family protein [Gammaproteobacteria bacterium]
MKKLIAIAMIGVLAIAVGISPTMAGKYKKQKVVYHINYDNPKRQSGALRNIQNHINAVRAQNLDLRVVIHGKGYTMLKHANTDANMAGKIDNLKSQGVKFNICNNTLRGKNIDYKKDLHDVHKEDIVPSGVAELAYLQAKGYAYIKP